MENLKLREARLAKNLSQHELGEKTYVTSKTIDLLEKGQYTPSLTLCLRICDALDTSLDNIFVDVERTQPTKNIKDERLRFQDLQNIRMLATVLMLLFIILLLQETKKSLQITETNILNSLDRM